MAAQAPGVLAYPLGVVADLVVGIEFSLDRASIEDVVASAAGGRAKRRRLARALLQRPAILTDGRSPAPRVIGNLLIALRGACAASISRPVCAECGRRLRTRRRRGEDWYCGACGPRPEPCTGCGLCRPVSVRDRAGKPHCFACQPQDSDADPATTVAEIIAVRLRRPG